MLYALCRFTLFTHAVVALLLLFLGNMFSCEEKRETELEN